MLFSKSFGYALRGILYVAAMQDEHRKVQVEEIATQLSVPRHFMGKILKKLVKENLLLSSKGPYGGFSLHPQALSVPLVSVVEITDGLSTFHQCVLRLKGCNPQEPCPLHNQMDSVKAGLLGVLETTTIQDLLQSDKKGFIKSIATNDIDIDTLYTKTLQQQQYDND
ncbi:MAG: Rrf2 family transcriptional regulator [Flavisolibacter sp.]|nr:Rrf2 family transcriptional regulator [Flavisolibacter sp.]